MLKRTSYRSDLLNDLKNEVGYAAKYLSAAIDDSREAFLVALRDVAEANKIARVAEEAQVNRESLYRTLSKEGNPTLETLSAVLDALGLKMAVTEKDSEAKSPIPAPPVSSQDGANTFIQNADARTAFVNLAGGNINILVIDGAGAEQQGIPDILPHIAAHELQLMEIASQPYAQ